MPLPSVERASRRPASAMALRRSVACALALLCLLGASAGTRADSAAGLSQKAIATVLARIAAESRRLELTTLEAVLTPDAEIAVQSSATGTLRTLRYSKAGYLDVARKVFASLAAENIRYAYREAAPDIRIAPDGLSAIVVGTSTEDFEFPDGRSMTTTTRSTLHFVWQDARARVERVQAIDQTPPPTLR